MTQFCGFCEKNFHESEMNFCSITGWTCFLCSKTKKDLSDEVNHSSHYQSQKMEVIEVIEAFNLDFCLGNAIKYILRAGKKGSTTNDLEKALWYITRAIEKVNEKEPNE